MVLGSYVGFFLGVSIGEDTGWEQRITVYMAPGGSPVAYLGNSNGMRGRV